MGWTISRSSTAVKRESIENLVINSSQHIGVVVITIVILTICLLGFVCFFKVSFNIPKLGTVFFCLTISLDSFYNLTLYFVKIIDKTVISVDSDKFLRGLRSISFHKT